MNHIKVNFPESAEKYEAGNGEGMWVVVDNETKAAHDSNAEGGQYWGILDNDSFYWRGLIHGARVPFEMRGEFRPVCPFEWLEDNYEVNAEYFGSRDTGANVVYYLDCLDGLVGERYLTLDELREAYYGEGYDRKLTERDAISIAADLEAVLYRCTVDAGEVVESTCIYDSWDCFG